MDRRVVGFFNTAAGGKMKGSRRPQRLSLLLQPFLFFLLLLLLMSKVGTAQSQSIVVVVSEDGRTCSDAPVLYAKPTDYLCIKVNFTALNLTCDPRENSLDVHLKSEVTGGEKNINASCDETSGVAITPPFEMSSNLSVNETDVVNISVGTALVYSIEVYVDGSTPFITILNPVDGALYHNSTLNYSMSVADNYGIKNCTLILDDGESYYIRVENESINASFAWINGTVENLPDGEFGLSIRCMDYAGNEGEEEIEFFVDANPPEISFSPYENGTGVRVEELEDVIITVFDKALNTVVDNTTCEYSVNGNKNEVVIDSMVDDEYNITIPAEELNRSNRVEIGVWCTDWYFNTSALFYMLVDFKPPEILTNLTNNSVHYEEEGNLSLTLGGADDASENLNCSAVAWFMNPEVVVLANETFMVENNTSVTFELDISQVSADTLHMNLSCADLAGRTSTEHFVVFIDRNEPEITLYPDEMMDWFDYFVVRGQKNPYLLFNVSDDATLTITCAYQFVNETEEHVIEVQNGSTLNISLEMLQDGNHTLELCCNDSVHSLCYGEDEGRNLVVLLDTVPPEPPQLPDEIVLLHDEYSDVFYYLNGTSTENISWSYSNMSDVDRFIVEVSATETFNTTHTFVVEESALNFGENAVGEELSFYDLIVSYPYLYIRVKAADIANNTSPEEETTLRVLRIEKYPNSTLVCENESEMGGICCLHTTSGNYYSGFDYNFVWSKTSDIVANEPVARYAVVEFKGYSDEIQPSCLNNGDEGLSSLLDEDQEFYHLVDGENMTLGFEKMIYKPYLCLVGYTTNNSALYLYGKAEQSEVIPPNGSYDLYCIQLEGNSKNVTLECSGGIASCYIDKAFLYGSTAFYGNVSQIIFEWFNITANLSINLINFSIYDWMEGNVSEVVVENDSFSTIPLVTSFNLSSRRQNPDRVSEVDGKAYSIINFTLTNLFNQRFDDVVVRYQNCTQAFGENAECSDVIISSIQPKAVVEGVMEVTMHDVITADYLESSITPLDNVIRVNEPFEAEIRVAIKNSDSIPYDNVVFRPSFNGWEGEEIEINMSSQEVKYLSVPVSKILIEETSMELRDERLKRREYLRRITINIFSKEDVEHYLPESVIYAADLAALPGFNMETCRVVLDDQTPLDSEVRDDSLVIYLPTDLEHGDHKIEIVYRIRKEERGEISGGGGTVISQPDNQTQENVNGTESGGGKVGEENSSGENEGKVNETAMTTILKEYRINYTKRRGEITFNLELPVFNETLVSVKIYPSKVPAGWKVTIEKSYIPFIKPGEKVAIPVKIAISAKKKAKKGVYWFNVVAEGLDEKGKEVRVVNKIIVDATKKKGGWMSSLTGRLVGVAGSLRTVVVALAVVLAGVLILRMLGRKRLKIKRIIKPVRWRRKL